MLFKNVNIDGLNIFYREAGNETAPKLVLLHGFPASSHQYRNLIPALADRFHVIAPDYPGFGNSAMPDPAKFAYTFDKTSEIIESFLSTRQWPARRFVFFSLSKKEGTPASFSAGFAPAAARLHPEDRGRDAGALVFECRFAGAAANSVEQKVSDL
jgi:pimeloyl-ACP methyl ester carboxylesterase